MKISPNSYIELKAIIQSAKIDIPQLRESIRESGNFKDLEMRVRWDLTYLSYATPFICTLYDSENVNDNHIDTALKRIVKELESV